MTTLGTASAQWEHVLDTRHIDPTTIVPRLRQSRYVFHAAFAITDRANMSNFRKGMFRLRAIAATDLEAHLRTTYNVVTLSRRHGYQELPLWLAVTIASVCKQEQMPSNYTVLMHEPLWLANKAGGHTRERVLAMIRGERELVLNAPRARSEMVWEEDRAFVFLESFSEEA